METIIVKNTINANIHKVWKCWTQPGHITKWNFASDEWHCPAASNDLRPGGKFSWRMEAKDGSFAFNYAGTYDKIEESRSIEKHLDDGRKVWIRFEEKGDQTLVTETFEPDENDLKLQKQGWQAILDNFKKYVEA